jgi:aminocarboxymuconate-semialdehyde decarboxylase
VFGAPHALEAAVKFFGVDRMLFASDFPFDPVAGQFIRDTISDVDALDVSDDERARIYAGNARDLLGIGQQVG